MVGRYRSNLLMTMALGLIQFRSVVSAFGLRTSSSSRRSLPRRPLATKPFVETISLKGIEWLQETVVETLNELYDPNQVAQANLLKKNKKQQDNDTMSQAATPTTPPELSHLQSFTKQQAMVTPATKPEFGDYQVNAAMGLAKALQLSPRTCAQQIVAALQPKILDYMTDPEIAGPGFVNLKFKPDYLTRAVASMAQHAQGRVGVPRTKQPLTIVVDYSSPNIAKEMHVGHLRSTIIGDTLANVLEFVGHDVVRVNHVGDWGTQFGMLVEHLRDEYPAALSKETSQDVDLGDLVQLYKAAKKRFDVNDDFKVRAREAVVKLQAGAAEERAAWESLCLASQKEYEQIYEQLNVNKGLQVRGESFYNPFLQGVVDDLKKQGLAVESDGATVVYLDGYSNKDGEPLPVIVQKTDGGYNYATTDLAAIRHRTLMPKAESGEKAQRVLYVTDAGQGQHFDMVFKCAQLAGFCAPDASLEHVPFGLVQGEDGKKFATRSGETVKLKDLLNEAVRIAGEDMRSRYENTADSNFLERLDSVAQIVGIGAVKYADLSMNRESNYRFSYARMLSLNGNTAPYMLYAYARICGIIRKATGQDDSKPIVWPEASEIIVSHESEIDLARSLVRLPDVIADVEKDLYPNRMCDYLFETSQKFNQFYENCSVKNAATPELRDSRLSLCVATAATIRMLMNLLGLEVVEKL